MNLWTPPKEWEGQEAYLIGGGPSLTGFDFSLLRGRNVIGCNDAFRLGPDIISYCIFGDPGWWQKNRHELEQWPGRLVTNAPTMLSWEVPRLHKMARERDGIHSGSTLGWNYSTGAAAINLAISLGAIRIYLLGYDLSNRGNVSHWHPWNSKTTQEYAFRRFLNGFLCVSRSLPPGVSVINVTDGSSRLPVFPRMSFLEFLETLKAVEKEEIAA